MNIHAVDKASNKSH